MVTRIDIGPEGGPFVELDEDNGDLIIRTPNDEISVDGSDIVNVPNLADDPHGNESHTETFAEDGDEQPPEEHDNAAHTVTFAEDGDEQPPEDHGNDAHETSVTQEIRDDSGESLIVEERTDDPSTPADGRVWVRTDLI